MTLVSAAQGTSRKRVIRRHVTAFFFLLPALAVYLTFVIYPFLNSIYLSFTKWDGVSAAKEWIGLQNYAKALSADKVLGQALAHNVIWIIVGTAAPLAIGLLLATIIWDGALGRLFYQTVFFMPYVLSTFVVGVIFGLIYNPMFGVLNGVLRGVGLDALAQPWLGKNSTALISLIAVTSWQAFGFHMTVLLAGLRNINTELLDAAKVDGANAWQRFSRVTVPQLTHVTTLLVVLSLINGFSIFGIVYAMTDGGPGHATEVVATYIFKQAFQQSFVGYGSALSIVLTLSTLVISILTIRLRERGD